MCPGGVVEAYPPSDSVTCLTVDLLLEPGGKVSMLSCGDQLHSSCPLKTLGFTVPQTSVAPGTLNSICMRVGQACLQRHVIGYVSVDLVTFLDRKTVEQKVKMGGTRAEQDEFMLLKYVLGLFRFNTWCRSFYFPISLKGINILGWIRDPYERIGASFTAPSGFGKQARQTVGAGTKCVTRPSSKLSGLIVSIHWFHHLKLAL